MSTHVKIVLKYEEKSYNIKVVNTTTVAQLQFKIRKLVKIQECDAMFIFFTYSSFTGNKQKLYAQNKLLTDIQIEQCKQVLEAEVLLENCFGELNSRFLKAQIKELKDGLCWTLKIEYSYYNLYTYPATFVFKSMEECIRKLAIERSPVLVIIDKDGNPISIEPEN